MKKQYRNGLIVGKFSLLHKGHEFLIETAVNKCEQVFIFSYSEPEFSGCESDKRIQWLSALFPNVRSFVFNRKSVSENFGIELPPNDADDCAQRRFVATIWLAVVNQPLDVVFTSEAYGDGFAEELGRSLPSYLINSTVKHELVDIKRTLFPISGSKLRENVHEFSHFLSATVYKSFVKRVCFIGAESTGKSTIARCLSEMFHTAVVPEYGRTLWEEKKGRLEFEDLLEIAKVHISNEDETAKTAKRFLFIDTTPLTTLFYSYNLFGAADPALISLSRREYDLTFLCLPDFPLVQDGTRSDESFRQMQHKQHVKELEQRSIRYVPLAGTIEKRLEIVLRSIQSIEDQRP